MSSKQYLQCSKLNQVQVDRGVKNLGEKGTRWVGRWGKKRLSVVSGNSRVPEIGKNFVTHCIIFCIIIQQI